MMFDEKKIVSRVMAGNVTAFSLLVKQYETLVYYIIGRLVENREDMEDICQEVFINVYTGLPDFGFRSKLSTWISHIAYNTSVSYLRKYKKNAAPAGTEYALHVHFADETPHDTAAKKEVSGYIRRLIQQLPEQYKTVLTLYHLDEFSYPEIAAVTGMPGGTVKGNLFRARKLLKEKLEVHLGDELG